MQHNMFENKKTTPTSMRIIVEKAAATAEIHFRDKKGNKAGRQGSSGRQFWWPRSHWEVRTP